MTRGNRIRRLENVDLKIRGARESGYRSPSMSESEAAPQKETSLAELALLFLRLYRSLDALLGGDAERCRKWLHAKNLHLAGTPADLIKTVTGLVYVNDYLDAMRGKV